MISAGSRVHLQKSVDATLFPFPHLQTVRPGGQYIDLRIPRCHICARTTSGEGGESET